MQIDVTGPYIGVINQHFHDVYEWNEQNPGKSQFPSINIEHCDYDIEENDE
jgi:hypothetical protein